MELTKNIFFNTDKLVENSSVKISYTGKPFQNNSTDVYLHYGFGSCWDNVNDIKMEKTDLGFQAEISLISSDSLNFCFKNSNNEWDNNNGCNYIFSIEKCTELIVSNDHYSIAKSKKLRKSYIIGKKVKITLYKAAKFFPKLISGNYGKKVQN